MFHALKIQPDFFASILDGSKTFEIRQNDRNFSVGDSVLLCEYSLGEYTGQFYHCSIVYITDFMQVPGYVVFGFIPSLADKFSFDFIKNLVIKNENACETNW